MATLTSSNQNSILKIREFLGLNENPDGDTHIKNGELSECLNFRVTQDRHLQLRPGQKTLVRLREAWDALEAKPSGVSAPMFSGAWRGSVNGAVHTLAAFGGVIWDVALDGSAAPKDKGRCVQAPTSFFGFGNKVYLLNGSEYLAWNGGASSKFQTVEGYIPTVRTASTPDGKGQQLESVNRLTGKRKVKFSPDGTATAFVLGEENVDEVVSVSGTSISHTLNKATGTVTFSSAPPKGTNTLVITYRKGSGSRGDVTGMRCAEFYNGAADTRVFLYGNGTNKTIYSGVDVDKGAPTAEYFPDLAEAAIGDANTPITAMIRHYARLLVFKPNSAWSVDYSTATTALGLTTSAFMVLPVNRQIGNVPLGQARLLENNPLTLADQNIYQWKASSSGGVTADPRNAQRISDRVRSSLAGFDFSKAVTFNRLRESEFWFLCGGKALILNYAADAWYTYDNCPFLAMLEADGEVYGFTKAGEVRHISRAYRNDDGAEITARAATGSMDFSRDWQLKYSPMIFTAIQPESGARVTVTVETNRRSDYPDKLVSAGLAGFSHVDFGHFSFGTNRKPQVKRVKMKVKKATFYKLIFKSKSASATVTLLESDVQLRYAGNVK